MWFGVFVYGLGVFVGFDLSPIRVRILFSAIAVFERLQTFLQWNLCVRLCSQQWAEWSSFVVGGHIVERELRLWEMFLFGDIGSCLCGSL